MVKWQYPTAFSSWRPYDSSAEWSAYDQVLRSGQLTMGPETVAFEESIASYHSRKHAIAVNSGSSANLVAIGAAKWWLIANNVPLLEDPVYEHLARVPAIAWSTTYSPLLQHRCALQVTDVTDTWNASTESTHLDITDIYVGCSILGNPAELSTEQTLAKDLNRFYLEDNCESLGAVTPDGKLTGTYGDISTGSGFYSHQVSAVELGWILTDNDDLARLCRLLRNHGNDGWGTQELETQYDFIVYGYNVRPVEAHCAVAHIQIARMDELLEARRWNAMYFRDATYRLPLAHQKLSVPIEQTSPFGFPFEVEDKTTRNRLATALREQGIDCRLPTGGSFTKHQYGKSWRNQPTPRADRVHDTGMFLGNAPHKIPDLIDSAVKIMRNVL